MSQVGQAIGATGFADLAVAHISANQQFHGEACNQEAAVCQLRPRPLSGVKKPNHFVGICCPEREAALCIISWCGGNHQSPKKWHPGKVSDASFGSFDWARFGSATGCFRSVLLLWWGLRDYCTSSGYLGNADLRKASTSQHQRDSMCVNLKSRSERSKTARVLRTSKSSDPTRLLLLLCSVVNDCEKRPTNELLFTHAPS